MQLQGSVISINLNTKKEKQGGGSYDAWEVIYRTPENEVKDLVKPIQSLKFIKGLKDSLASLKPGDNFVCNMEKNARDYWEVETIVKVDAAEQAKQQEPSGGLPAEAPTPPAPAHAVRSGKVLGNTYETPEERAKKQVVIVRQSSLDYAIKFYATQIARGVLDTVSQDDILAVAERFEKHVHAGLKAAAKRYLEITLGDVE